MYKMVAIDLDDTLLSDNHEISTENSKAISKALEKGVAVCLVSGRSYSSTKRYIELLNLRHLTGSLNGACIIEPCNDKLMHSYSIERSLGFELVKKIEAYGVHMNFYHGHSVACREENRFSLEYQRLTSTEIKYVGMLSDYAKTVEAGKLLLTDEIEKLEKIRLELLDSYSMHLNITYSKPDFLEIYSKDTSKGQAVRKIAEYYGLSTAEVVAIGDGENDVSMLECAGIGVAMGNASLNVREKADFVTFSNNENGVAHALQKFVLSSIE
jgi:Cof subfamily protein (haloacid dehalogenase superfamily)